VRRIRCQHALPLPVPMSATPCACGAGRLAPAPRRARHLARGGASSAAPPTTSSPWPPGVCTSNLSAARALPAPGRRYAVRGVCTLLLRPPSLPVARRCGPVPTLHILCGPALWPPTRRSAALLAATPGRGGCGDESGGSGTVAFKKPLPSAPPSKDCGCNDSVCQRRPHGSCPTEIGWACKREAGGMHTCRARGWWARALMGGRLAAGGHWLRKAAGRNLKPARAV
jgi:hypothetical protein